MKLIRRCDLVEMPWKNGGGVTRDIAVQRDADGILWRLSMADVDRDGAFSSFAGLTRILTVVGGDGMVLHTPEAEIRADHASPVRFDGGAPVHARLTQGPIRDFNLMFDTARCSGAAEILRAAGVHEIGQGDQTAVLHVIAEEARASTNTLGEGDTLIADAPLRIDLAQGAVALAITLERTG
ncbi:HutD family protein [Marivita sp. GX14005]|uniref:HutD/Ves family protein n=1 Tax=Marivita sp. GX14005 TaxID=2942276 RepID=UPI0020196E05|nr:HutD family protein [Marivita sp. GX14005]MCL3883338.1 HutD family protein [Marivita sp. GX14005]